MKQKKETEAGVTLREKKKVRLPHVYILLLIIICFVWALTYVIPTGEFEREMADGKNIVIPGTYHQVDAEHVSVFAMISAIPQGFVDMADIIVLMFVCVGSIGMYTSTGAIERVFGAFMERTGSKARIMMLTVFYLFFFIKGGLTGSVNTPIAFIPLVITLCLACGYDTMTGLGLTAIGALVGFSVGPTNPNTVVVAQGLSELPIYSGMGYRSVCWIIVGIVGYIYIIRYAEKVRKRPELSLGNKDVSLSSYDVRMGNTEATKRDNAVVMTLITSIVAIAALTVVFSLSMVQMTALYLIVGVAGGIVAGYKPAKIADTFTEYGKDMFLACMVLALAKSISIILTEGGIIDTIIYWASEPLSKLPGAINAAAMFVVQTIVNFFINSGSGQAAAMMPIMAPLSDLIGVSRQTAVLAFQMGDGFSNMIWPTSSALMAYIFAAKENYGNYLKFIMPLFGIICVISVIMLVVAAVTGY